MDEKTFEGVEEMAESLGQSAQAPQKPQKKGIKDLLRSAAEWFRAIPGKIISYVMPNGKLNPKRLALVIGCALLSLALLCGIVWGCIALFNKDVDSFDPGAQIEELDPDGGFPKDMYGVEDAGSLNELLKSWATNGMQLARSDNVVNILLIGTDSRSEGGAGRSDAMILLSLNKYTKKITLASFPRDSYTYMEINGEGRFDKVNHSFIWGGPEALVATLENDYKIDIDHYAYVDFVTFANVIDILGGVNITVTEAEASEVNNNSRTYYGVKLTAGEDVLLNGKQALAYSRIRHIGTDTARTERQRKVISKLIAKAKDATLEQVTKMASEVLKNLKTDLSLTDFIGYGTQAVTQGWPKYAIESVEMPENTDLRRGTLLRGSYASPYSAISFWVIDYPRAAYDLQMRLYGQSNIIIDENTTSAIDLLTPPAKPVTTTAAPQANGTTTTLPTASTSASGNGETTTASSTAPQESSTTAVPESSTTAPPDSTTSTTAPSTQGDTTTSTTAAQTTTTTVPDDSTTTTTTAPITTTTAAATTTTAPADEDDD
ncbi:MAG: LCP family protein [Clostridium sp.]|jgi:LCP family protein required for cell wall assembly|nr:LCP family protein [Clostridium sp.]